MCWGFLLLFFHGCRLGLRRVYFYTVPMALRITPNAASKAGRVRAAERASKPRETKTQRLARQAAEQLDLETEELRAWVCGWDFEQAARAEGARLIAGVDEVGRGPLFGPVVAAAVILPESCCLDGLNDSKKLSEEERERFDAMVREVAVCWAVAEVDVQTIDRINILQASRLAM